MDGLKTYAGILKLIGIPGFCVSFLALFLVWFGSEDQKQEFIDTYFLLKNIDNNPFPFALLIIILGLIILVQNMYFTDRIKTMRQENKRIGKEKSLLMEKILNTSLESADTPQNPQP